MNTPGCVTLMVSLGVFLIGTGYTIHKNTVTFNDLERPYDFMFVENDKYNHISQDEIRKVIEDNGVFGASPNVAIQKPFTFNLVGVYEKKEPSALMTIV